MVRHGSEFDALSDPDAGGPLRLLPFGDRGVLVEVDTLDEVLALHARLAASRPDGVVDLVPAARTVLVHVDARVLGVAAARAWIVRAGVAPVPPSPGAPPVELPIVYDGPDLVEVAEILGIGPVELAERHAACEWTVAFTGFAPGFGYLVSADWPYDIPRRATPRTRVAAGAVGLAGGFAGAYPRETPGGWQLIGTTSAVLFDPRSAAALLTPGARVRFTPVSAVAPVPASALAEDPLRHGDHMPSRAEDAGAPSAAAPPRPSVLTVREAGLLATVQDLGRAGRAAEGIAPSGAADRAALRTANRLLGNREDAAGIEITMGGFRAVAGVDLWIAVTGAWGPVRIAGRAVDPYSVHPWRRGEELHLDWFAHGARAYLAVRGGLDLDASTPGRVAGSLSTDILSGLGPAPLRAGDALTLSRAAAGPIPPEDLHPWSPPTADDLEIALAPGPRAEWFADAAALYDRVWTVSNEADRVGIRLDGPRLRRVRTGELPSEGMLPGAIQVPPDGRPVVLGPDGPVTGGYPVVAVVTDAARDALAQARPGTRVRFRHARPARQVD